jgi:hypothetical protein
MVAIVNQLEWLVKWSMFFSMLHVSPEPAQDPSRAPASEASVNRETVIAALDGKSQKPIADAAVVAGTSYAGGRAAGRVLLPSTEARGEGPIICPKSGLVALSVMVGPGHFCRNRGEEGEAFEESVSACRRSGPTEPAPPSQA